MGETMGEGDHSGCEEHTHKSKVGLKVDGLLHKDPLEHLTPMSITALLSVPPSLDETQDADMIFRFSDIQL